MAYCKTRWKQKLILWIRNDVGLYCSLPSNWRKGVFMCCSNFLQRRGTTLHVWTWITFCKDQLPWQDIPGYSTVSGSHSWHRCDIFGVFFQDIRQFLVHAGVRCDIFGVFFQDIRQFWVYAGVRPRCNTFGVFFQDIRQFLVHAGDTDVSPADGAGRGEEPELGDDADDSNNERYARVLQRLVHRTPQLPDRTSVSKLLMFSGGYKGWGPQDLICFVFYAVFKGKLAKILGWRPHLWVSVSSFKKSWIRQWWFKDRAGPNMGSPPYRTKFLLFYKIVNFRKLLK